MQSSGKYIRKLTSTYLAILLCQILFLLFIFLELNPSAQKEVNISLCISEIVFSVITLIISYVLYGRYLGKAKKKRGIREKLTVYMKALYIQWSIIGIVSLISIVFYIVTEADIYIYITLFSIIVYIVNRPGINRICNELDLDKNEKNILKTPNAAL